MSCQWRGSGRSWTCRAFVSQPQDLTCGDRAGDSPRLKGSERGYPPGQGGAPKAETLMFNLRTLSGRGARYPGRKARREESSFVVCGTRNYREDGIEIVRSVEWKSRTEARLLACGTTS